MGKGKRIFLALLVLLSTAPLAVHAGDEDKKNEKPVQAPKEPEPIPEPVAPEAPEMSLPEDASPSFEEPAEEQAASPAPRRSMRGPFDPDKNLNYAELLSMAETASPARGVLPPGLGTRGYRPNLVAIGTGERLPGAGVMVEYSWNRLAAGVLYSFRRLKDVDRYNDSQSFAGFYSTYRWLPWDFSPYFLLGVEFVTPAPESTGGMAGAGLELRIYSGWTLLAGYTYHTTVHKGFLGGAFGWSF